MKRLECLDGLRGVLAVYVMIGHMAPFAASPDAVVRPLSHGGAAVDVFFMLSGLVIMRSLQACDYAARPFLIARFARIFPVFLVMFLAGVAVQPLPVPFGAMPWIGPESPAHGIWSTGWPLSWPLDVMAHLTMTHGLFPNAVAPFMWVSFLGAAWSLSTEWQFYILALCLGRTRMGAGWLVVCLFCVALAGLIWDMAAPEAWHFSRAFLPNKAAYFALGIASGIWVDSRRFVGFMLALAATLGMSVAHGRWEALLPPLFWTLCLAAQLYPRGLAPVAFVLRSRPVRYLGAISFPIYLANEPIQKILGIFLSGLALSLIHI